MYMQMRYTLFVWIPPPLTAAERLWLGSEVARVGPAAFARALKAKMSEPRRARNEGKFSLGEVIQTAALRAQSGVKNDTERLGNDTKLAGIFLGLIVFLWLSLTTYVWSPWHLWRYFFFVFVAAPFFLSVTLATMLLMHHRIERWVRGLMDEYTKATLSQ